MKDKDPFTAREVATLVEDLRGEIRSVAEGVVSLQSDMVEVKGRLGSIESEVRSIKDVLRVNVLPRISRLESKVGL